MADPTEPSPKKLKLNSSEAVEPGQPEAEECPLKADVEAESEEAAEKEKGLDADGEGIRGFVLFERQPAEMGMTEFLGLQRGFEGIVKNRWEDFHVHEIDLDGNVVRLTSTDLPEEDTKEKPNPELAVLSEEVRTGLEGVMSGELPKFNIPAPDDKQERKKLHFAIKAEFPQLNSNTTQQEDGTKFLEIVLKNNVKGPKRDTSSPPVNCRFVLHKKGRDTGGAVSILATLLKIPHKSISFCGNKDRRGVTSQLMTVFRVSATRMLALNPRLRCMKVGNFSYSRKSVRLGDLNGNRFTIAIREVEGSKADIEEAVQSLREHGFINYFGMQRFGSSPVPSFEIGLAMLRGQWEHAIDLILAPQPTDLPVVRDLKRKFADSGDAAAALEGMSDHISRYLLRGVAKYGKSLRALEELPRQTRLLYIHSLQSLMWNRLASRRIREMGPKVCPGDLFIRKECRDVPIKSSNAIVEVTEKNRNDVTIYDLVIPLPGHDVTFGQGVIKDWYQELLTEMNFTESLFMTEVRGCSAAGAYRKFIVRPTDVSHHMVQYSDPEQPLIASDWDILTGQRAVGECKDGKFRAVVMTFSLPQSSYATVAMREMMRKVRIKK